MDVRWRTGELLDNVRYTFGGVEPLNPTGEGRSGRTTSAPAAKAQDYSGEVDRRKIDAALSKSRTASMSVAARELPPPPPPSPGAAATTAAIGMQKRTPSTSSSTETPSSKKRMRFYHEQEERGIYFYLNK